MRSVEEMALVHLEVASACIITMQVHVKDVNAKYANMPSKTAQTEKDLCSRMSSL